VSMSPYSVKALSGELSVTNNTPESTNIRTGKITSTNSAKRQMGVYYGERELARSTNEIAFAKVDLIVSQGPGTNGGIPLPEDRQPAGGTAPATNELNPGTIVLLLPQDQTNRVATTLTLKADPTGGSVTLDQHGLTDLKIYTNEALQQELPIPKTWTNGETSPTTLYMVGSSSSTNLQSAQGTLDLTYKANLAADGVEYSIKDTVGVTLLPVDIDVVHPATGEMTESRESSEGGYIPIKRNEQTPVTKLKLHKLEGMANAQFKLVFSSNKIKLWKQFSNGVFSEAVASDSTPFPANQDTEVFVEGVTKSDSTKDVEVGMKVVVGSTESSPVQLKLTVVQAEFPMILRAFIPYRWTQPDFSPTLYTIAAEGDNRGLVLQDDDVPFRVRQKVTITPYTDLHSVTDLNGERVTDTAPLSRHYDKNSDVPVSERGGVHGSTIITGALPEDSGAPTFPVKKIEFKTRTSPRNITYYLEASAEDGAMPWYVPAFAAPNIDWKYDIKVDCTDPAKPQITATGERDGFPAYEIVAVTSDGTIKDVYYWRPPVNVQVGLGPLTSPTSIGSPMLEVP